MLGERPTIADISLFAYLYYPADEFGFDIAGQHKNIGAWLDRIKALPGWKHPYDLMPGYPLPNSLLNTPSSCRMSDAGVSMHADSARRQPAVDHELGAGDETRFVRQQIDAHFGDFGRRAEPAERNVARELARALSGTSVCARMSSTIGPSRKAGWTELQRTCGWKRAPCSATDLLSSRTPPLEAL